MIYHPLFAALSKRTIGVPLRTTMLLCIEAIYTDNHNYILRERKTEVHIERTEAQNGGSKCKMAETIRRRGRGAGSMTNMVGTLPFSIKSKTRVIGTTEVIAGSGNY